MPLRNQMFHIHMKTMHTPAIVVVLVFAIFSFPRVIGIRTDFNSIFTVDKIKYIKLFVALPRQVKDWPSQGTSKGSRLFVTYQDGDELAFPGYGKRNIRQVIGLAFPELFKRKQIICYLPRQVLDLAFPEQVKRNLPRQVIELAFPRNYLLPTKIGDRIGHSIRPTKKPLK